MTWFKLDDNFARNPKVLQCSPEAMWLYVAAGCYCGQYLTDGVVPAQAIPGLTTIRKPMPRAFELVAAGLWHVVDGGDAYEMHDYLDYNPSREQVEEERRKARERRTNGGKRSGERRANVTNPDPTRPEVLTEPLGDTPKTPRSRGTRIDETFTVTEAMGAWVLERCPNVDWNFQTEKFVNFWKAKAGKDAVKADWERTWRNWMMEAQERSLRLVR